MGGMNENNILCSRQTPGTADQNPCLLAGYPSCIDDRIDGVEIVSPRLDWASRRSRMWDGGWYVGQSLHFNLSLLEPNHWTLTNTGCCIFGRKRRGRPENSSHAGVCLLLQSSLLLLVWWWSLLRWGDLLMSQTEASCLFSQPEYSSTRGQYLGQTNG